MSNSLSKLFSLILVTILFSVSCGDDSISPDYSLVPEPYDISTAAKNETDSGLVYYNVKEGNGEFEVVYRDVVQYRYTVRSSSGEIISSTYTNLNTQPFAASVSSTSSQSLVFHPGVKEGLLGMKPGQIKVMFLPPDLHRYSSSLSDDTIRIDLELVKIVF